MTASGLCIRVLAPLFAIVVALPSLAADASQYVGEWRAVRLEGGWAGSAECLAFFHTERHLTLRNKLGEDTQFAGEWTTVYVGRWTKSNQGRCRWPGGSSFSPQFARISSWSVSGSYDPSSGALSISGRNGKCVGDGCGDLKPDALSDFTTAMVLRGDSLVDTYGTTKSDDDLPFESSGAYAKGQQEMRLAAQAILRVMDSGDAENLYTRFLSARARQETTQANIAQVLQTMHDRVGVPLSRSSVDIIHANQWPSFVPGSGEFGIMVNAVHLPRDRTTPEFLFLIKESGSWKIYSFAWP